MRYWTWKKNSFEYATHFLHDASFSFRECRVSSQLIVYVFHFNLNTSFGFLAVWETLGICTRLLLRCCGCRRSRWRRYTGRRVGITVESIIRVSLMQRLILNLFTIILFVLFIPFAVALFIVLMMTFQIVFVIWSYTIGSRGCIKLLIWQLSLGKVLMEQFCGILL